MALIDELIEKARKTPKAVALPECDNEDTLLAARRVADDGIGTPVLVSPADVIAQTAERAGVSTEGMRIIDTSDAEAADALAERYMNAGRERLFSAKAARRKLKNPLNYAMMLEELGDVDCTFCGHTNTTGDVLMAAQMIIGLADGVDVPSILALVQTPGFDGPEGDVIALTDCGLNPEPSAEELASIAIAACDNVSALMDWEPRCAFISYSTDGSGESASVERIREAISIARDRRPDLALDGEFQLDAAIRPDVAAKKVHRPSEVAGRANVIVWPDINVGNIGVKLVQNFAHANAYGPFLQGFKKVVCDCSRSSPVPELVGNVVMSCVRAQALKEA